MKAPLSPDDAPGDARTPDISQPDFPGPAWKNPAWKNNAAYDLLRQMKRRTRARLHSARLAWRVRNGFRLVPERAFEDCLAAAIERLRAEDPGEPRGDYLEFGVCHGASMACMHRVSERLGLAGLRLIGFDSFEGLPPEAAAPDEGPWLPGQYRCTRAFARRFLERAGVDWQRTFLVKGWFRDTLTAATRERHRIERASLIMVDCDICASAREALAFVAPLIRERAVILFDDWHASGLAEQGRGERRAFEEFLAAHPDIEASPLPAYSENSEVFLLRRQRH
jgi:hypothetical protein